MAKVKTTAPTYERAWTQPAPRRSEELEPLTDELLVKITGKKEEKDDAKALKVVGFFDLFRFSDGVDRLLMLFGLLCASIHGASSPIWMVVFGDMIESFVGTGAFLNYLGTIEDFLHSINKTKLEVLSNPRLFNCSNVQAYYGVNGTCFEDQLQERILDQMMIYALYYCVIGASVMIVAYGQIVFWMIAAERQAHRIRRACLNNVLRQDIGWFDTHEITELNTRLGDDVHKIQEGIGDKVSTFWQWFTCSILSVIIGLVYGWQLCLVVLSISPVMVVTTALFSRLASSVSNKELSAYAQAGAIAQEVFAAIRTVVAFGGQEKEAERYKRNLSAAQAFGVKKGFSNGISMGFIWLAVFSIFGLGFYYGGKLFREDDDYGTSNVIIVIFAVLFAAYAIGNAAPCITIISNARGAACTMYKLIDCKSMIDSSSKKGLQPASVTGTIKFEDLHFRYPARPDVKVLDGVSLEAKQGQTVALVGASGCGKSTIVQLILRFYDPLSGKVMIDGHDIRDLNIKWLRQHIGLVSQEPVLFATTIAENIRYGRDDVTMEEIVEATKNANAYDFIMKLPATFETLVGERGSQLSGGQKQRLAIARALVRDPKILLLDEATSALDMESESIVQDALDKAREGRTTIVIAHRLSTIKTADIIMGINDGQVAEVGTHNELMDKQGIYYQLVMNQQADGTEEGYDQENKTFSIEDSLSKLASAGAPLTTFTASDKEIDAFLNAVRDPEGHKLISFKKAFDSISEEEEVEEEDLPDAPFTHVMKLNAPEWHFICLGCLGSIVNGGVWPSFAVIFSRILKTFTYSSEEKQKEEMQFYTLLFIGIGVLSFITYFVQCYFFGRSGEALTTKMRDMSFRAMLKQKISWFDENKNNVGALTTRLSTDAALVQGVTGHRLGGAIMSASSVILSVVVAFIHGWQMTFVILGLLPILVVAGLMQIRLMAGQAGTNKEAFEKAGKVTVESIENIKTVASLTKEPKFLNIYMESLKEPYRAALRNSHVIALAFGISNGVLYFAYAASFAFGAFMMEQGEMKLDDVFIVFSSIMFGSVGLGYSSAFAPDLGKAQASARRIMHIIDSVPALDYSSLDGERYDNDYEAEITFKNVTFSYPTRSSIRVLHDITFTVSSGQTLALVGSSGCGKSTSMQLIERFYDCDSGQVALDSHDVRDLNIKWLREQIGIVSQEPVLFDRSIAENIAYGDNKRAVTMDEIIIAARNANIHSFIASLPDGYDTNVGPRGTQLSGGQKQRIAIARALVRNPKVLLLDEATSALDTESEKVVQEALDKAREGRTCIVIAHRLSTVQTADQICVVSHGRVSESGTHSELMAKQGFYFRLVKKSLRES